MLSFKKIAGFLKKVGNRDAGTGGVSTMLHPLPHTAGESTTSAVSASGGGMPSAFDDRTTATTTVLQGLPHNATTQAILSHLEQLVTQRQRDVYDLLAHDPVPPRSTSGPVSPPAAEVVTGSEEDGVALGVSPAGEDVMATEVTDVLPQLQRDRAEMIDALDICLQEIPDVEGGVREDNAESTLQGVALEEPITPDPTRVDSGGYTVYAWRRLLLQIVDVLMHIDSVIYRAQYRRCVPVESDPAVPPALVDSDGAVMETAALDAPSPPTPAALTETMDDGTQKATSSLLLESAPTTTTTPVGAVTDAVTNPTPVAETRVSPGTTGGKRDDAAMGRNKPIEELISTACSVATWTMLRSVLQHHLQQLASPTAPRARMKMRWSDVVHELCALLSLSDDRFAECLLCASFIRDDGRELMLCMLQDPKPQSLLRQLLARVKQRKQLCGRTTTLDVEPTPPIPAPSCSPANARVGTAHPTTTTTTTATVSKATAPTPAKSHEEEREMDDLLAELEFVYAESISTTWAAYLADTVSMDRQPSALHLDPGASAEVDDVRTLCQLATAYFFCSHEWTAKEREARFALLYRNVRAGLPRWFARKPDAASIETVAAPRRLRCSAADGVGQEMLERVLHMAWLAALHKRVEHCLAMRPPHLDDAERHAREERLAANVFNDLRGRQRGYGSLVNAQLAAGKSREALAIAHRHFKQEQKMWTSRAQTIFSAVRYLQSMVQLVRAQASCRDYGAVVETVQFVLPQAALCEQMLYVLAPKPRGSFVIRFSESRYKILRAQVFLHREAWRAYASVGDPRAERSFGECVHHMQQLRRRWREDELYEAYMHRGGQLIQERSYAAAVELFRCAVELAKRALAAAEGTNNSNTSQGSTAATTASPGPATSLAESHAASAGAFYKTLHLRVAGSGSLCSAEEHDGNVKPAAAMELPWRVAESERMLALAYVAQAEHEVNVPHRRLELNYAVNTAYASQNSLQSWQAKGGTPKRLLTAVPCSLLSTCRALLLLQQSKKAVLRLEPLIEDKANSAKVQPPMWREILSATEEPLTAEDIVLRVDVNSVKIAVYVLYAQCLVQFDGDRALHAVAATQRLLDDLEDWAGRVRYELLRNRPRRAHTPASHDALRRYVLSVLEKRGYTSRSTTRPGISYTTPPVPDPNAPALQVAVESTSERLTALRALRQSQANVRKAYRDVVLVMGDAFGLQHAWESALEAFSTALEFCGTDATRTTLHGPPVAPETDSIPTRQHSPRVGSNTDDDDNDGEDIVAGVPEGAGEGATASHDLRAVLNGEGLDDRAVHHLILSKLAEVYHAMGMPGTALRYHAQVREGARRGGDRLLEYHALLHMARLHTAVHDHATAQEMWGEVSELARRYQDTEVARETTRNIVSSQEAAGLFRDVLGSARELEQLARGAEGAGAVADRQYALEALAGAHLALGQYKEALVVLEERETVQETTATWSGRLYDMRAKALLKTEHHAEALKVLQRWIQNARQMHHWAELGKANAALGAAYAGEHKVYKARRCHEAALAAFSLLLPSGRGAEVVKGVMESARWLVHDYYLNDEEVQVDGELRDAVAGTANASHGPRGGRNRSVDHALHNHSGDLQAMLDEDERLRAGWADDVDDLFSTEPDSMLTQSFTAPPTESVATTCAEPTTRVVSSTRGPDEDDGGGPVTPETTSEEGSEGGTMNSNTPRAVGAALGSVSLCKRLAAAAAGTDVLESNPTLSDSVRPRLVAEPPPLTLDDDDDAGDGLRSWGRAARVRTTALRAAVEVMEWSMQLWSGTTPPYAPAEAVDLALLTHPESTVVVFFAEFATALSARYAVVVRPAHTAHFIRRLALVTSLHKYHGAAAAELPARVADLYDELWSPVEAALHLARVDATTSLLIVPDATLLHVPFAALRPDTGVPLALRHTLGVLPSLTHLTQHAVTTTTWAGPGLALLPYATSPSRASDAVASPLGRCAEVRVGCTRKELLAAFATPHDPLLLLCDPVGTELKVADGTVTFDDLAHTRGVVRQAASVLDSTPHSTVRGRCGGGGPTPDLIVLANDRAAQTCSTEPGLAVRLCTQLGCRRVLRVDLTPGTGVTAEHQAFLALYMEQLETARRFGQRDAYALALRMSLHDALQRNVPATVWASFTLVGAL